MKKDILHPIVVQSMTKTDTAAVTATVACVCGLREGGTELARATVNSEAGMGSKGMVAGTKDLAMDLQGKDRRRHRCLPARPGARVEGASRRRRAPAHGRHTP